jgi:hypothetical protein
VSRRGLLAFVVALGCAPIDVNSQVSMRPREATPQQFGFEQLAKRDYVVDFVQLGPRLLVEIREHQSCVAVHHVPVMRVEHIKRTNRGFVAWDFALGTLSGAFAGLAFARPQLFSDRLLDGQGRVVYTSTGGYIVGSVFAVLSAGLFAAGIVDALRSRDTTRYAEAYELELGRAEPCAGSEERGAPVRERSLRLVVDGELELEGQTDEQGRARFELPHWERPVPANGQVHAVLEIVGEDGSAIEPRVLVLSLRVPFEGMIDAHTGIVDTRGAAAQVAEPAPIEGPIEGPSLPEPELQ